MKRGLFLVLLCLVYLSVAQEQEGVAYFSYQDFKENKPVFSASVTIRDDFENFKMTKNPYLIKSKDKQLQKRIENEIWGVYIENALYLNGKFFSGIEGYCKIEEYGKYNLLGGLFTIKDSLKDDTDLKLSLTLKKPLIKKISIGHIEGSIMGTPLKNNDFFLYFLPVIYDMESNERFILNRYYVEKLIDKHSDLKNQFEKEDSKGNKETLLKYIKRLNELEK